MSFVLDYAAIGRVLGAAEAVAVLETKAAAVVSEAISTGPRSGRNEVHEVDLIAVGETHLAADGAVVDIDWPSHVWHLLEFGSQNNPAYRPITRAAENNGLTVIDHHH